MQAYVTNSILCPHPIFLIMPPPPQNNQQQNPPPPPGSLSNDASQLERDRRIRRRRRHRCWQITLIIILTCFNGILYALVRHLEHQLAQVITTQQTAAKRRMKQQQKDNQSSKLESNQDQNDDNDEDDDDYFDEDHHVFSSSPNSHSSFLSGMDQISHKLVKPMELSHTKHLHTSHFPSGRHPPRSQDPAASATLYWQRAATNLLADWDATLDPSRDIVAGLLLVSGVDDAATSGGGGGGTDPTQSSVHATTTATSTTAASTVQIPATSNDPLFNASSSSSSSVSVKHQASARQYYGWLALQRAARQGHPAAQYVVANALASGVWPMETQPYDWVDAALSNDDNRHGRLIVQDTWIPPHDKDNRQSHQQQTEAMILWHLAAVGGHVEAAMTLAHRMEEQRKFVLSSGSASSAGGGSNSGNGIGMMLFGGSGNLGMSGSVGDNPFRVTTATSTSDQGGSGMKVPASKKLGGGGSSSKSNSKSAGAGNWWHAAQFCSHVLPYYEAAAHGIIDQLEADPQSRAKVLPPKEGHALHQVHLHGGTGSQLEPHNKPDESASALQFYHVRALDPHTGKAASPHAAYTLATLYHSGFRGVPQNLTMAAKYYALAAKVGHWEAAGQVGNFYLWGLGVDHDPYEAAS